MVEPFIDFGNLPTDVGGSHDGLIKVILEKGIEELFIRLKINS